MPPESSPAVPRMGRRSLTSGAAATLLASVVSVGITVATSIIIARALGPEIKGQIDLITATSLLASIVFGFSLTSGVTFVVAQGMANRVRLIRELAAIAIVQSTVIWLAASLLSATPLAHAFIPPEYAATGAIVMGAYAFANLLYGYGRSLLSGLHKFVLLAGLDLGARFLSLGLVIFALLWFGSSHERVVTGIIVGSITALFLSALISFFLIGKKHEHSRGNSQLQSIWRYSLPAFASNLVQFANYRLDIFLVAYYAGIREVALYGVAVSVAQALWLPSNAMQAVLFPRIASLQDPVQRAADTAQIMRMLFLLTLAGGAVLGLAAPWIISFLFGERFAQSLLPLWLLLPGFVLFCIANVLCAYLAGVGKPKLNLRVSLVGLIATLLLDFALIPSYGIAGAAVASSISYSLSAAVALFYFVSETQLSARRVLFFTQADSRLAFQTLTRLWKQRFSRFSSE